MINIKVQIKSHFDGQESMKREVAGKYSFRQAKPFTREFLEDIEEEVIPKGEARLMYKQVLMEGEAPVPETLKVTIDEKGRPLMAQIHRSGSDFLLQFEKGETWETFLATPAGNLQVGIRTTKLQGLLTEGHIDLEIAYEMILGGDSQGVTRVRYQSK